MEIHELLQWALGGLMAALFAILNGLGFRIMKKVDALENSKADKEDTNRKFEKLTAHVDAHAKENQNAHERIIEQLGQTNVHLARIEGTLANHSESKRHD